MYVYMIYMCKFILYFIREKHKRYTPDPITGVKQRKRKHKRKSLDIENPEVQSQPEVHRRITIKVLILFPSFLQFTLLCLCVMLIISSFAVRR